MAIHVRIRDAASGEHIDDGTDVWDGTSLDAISLSADDLGCEPGALYVVELVDYETGNVESLYTSVR